VSSERAVAAGTVDAMSLEAILDRLGGVVEQLERGDIALEESLRIFEEGVRLTREGQRRLDAAERRVEQLVAGQEGEVSLVPVTTPPRG